MQAGFRSPTLCRRERVDVVHAHAPSDKRYGRALVALTRLPIVFHLHAPHPNPRRGRSWRSVARAGVDRGLARLDRTLCSPMVVACSEWVASSHAPYLASPLRVVDNGVDTAAIAARAERSRLRTELGVAATVPVLCTVARLVGWKRTAWLVGLLARVRRQHPDAVLVVAGDGPERQRIERIAHGAGLADAVHLLGPRADVPEVLGASDVFVFPSTRREAFGIAVVEAMAAGLPVAAFRIPPFDSIVADGHSGVLATNETTDALAMVVLRILADAGAARAMGERGRRIARDRFDVARVAADLEAVYAELLGRPVGRAEPAAVA